MIRVPHRPLPATAAAKLREYQAAVTAAGGFRQQVAKAKILFKQRNTNRNATFKEVRRILDEMCSGARRCCYCEDSVADEVEHIKPKDWYPGHTFVWENYLYACGACNGPKNNRFGIFHAKNGRVVELARATGSPLRKPPPGDPLLIDPRVEDPLDFLELDLSGTFLFLPRERLHPRDVKRAEYTIDLLRLNARDVLARARRNAFGTYYARLEQYTARKEAGEPAKSLSPLIDDLKQVPHPTVWAEMKRQRGDYSYLQKWFKRAPEALTW